MSLKSVCIILICCSVSYISVTPTGFPEGFLSTTFPETGDFPIDNPEDVLDTHYTWNISTGNTSGSPVNIIFSDIGANGSVSGYEGISARSSFSPVNRKCEPVDIKPAIYWKDYNGPPGPEDAVVAGFVTTSGIHGETVSVCVGQVADFTPKAGLQPVAVYSNFDSVQSSYKGIRTLKNNIKVLCTNVPTSKLGEHLRWIPAEDAYKLDSETDIVVTGYQDTYKLHTGRTILNGQVIIGKVVRDKTLMFHYPLGEKEITSPTNFEVLVYTKAVYKIRKTVTNQSNSASLTF